MAGTGIVVEGEAQLTRSLHTLAGDLEDAGPADAAAAGLVLSRAAGRTPRLSGELAASGRVVADSAAGIVAYEAEHAGPVHQGVPSMNIAAQPWLADAFGESLTQTTAVYVDYVDKAVSKVKGA